VRSPVSVSYPTNPNMKTIKYFLFITAFLLVGEITIYAQLPSYLPTNGLVAWYPFNGNANDESGNGNDGVVNGATLTLDRFGSQDFAYSFDGLNDNISVNSDSSITGFYNFSIALWFKPNYFPNEDLIAILSKWAFPTDCGYQGEDYGIWLTTDGRAIGGTKVNTQSNTMPSFNSTIGDWQQLTFIHDATSGSAIYKDGILSQVSSQNGSLCYLFNNLVIGAGESLPFAGTRQFNGSIDDIAIYNRALSAAEVSALYTATATNNGGGSFSTAPPGIPYQAEVRNDSGEVLANANVNVRFTLHELTANGAVSYQETHALTTNELGLFAATIGAGTIGAGTATQGTFAGINWAQTTKFLQVEVDAGNGYFTMGNQQLMSVPYALYAANGPAGPVGPVGQTGPQGEAGLDGIAGANGSNGQDGVGIQSITTSGTNLVITLTNGQTQTIPFPVSQTSNTGSNSNTLIYTTRGF